MIRWPNVTVADSVDDQHVVSAIDFLPTLLDVMQTKHPTPDRLHGRSFASVLRGEAQSGRDVAFLQYNENAGRNRHPMRGVHTRDWLYLFNPWSNGERKFATATTGTRTYRQMVAKAKSDPAIAERLKLFDHRVVEELYHVAQDPNCLNNLAVSPGHRQQLLDFRKQLAERLVQLEDKVAPLAADVDNVDLRQAFMKAEDELKKSFAKTNRAEKRTPNRKPTNQRKKQPDQQ